MDYKTRLAQLNVTSADHKGHTLSARNMQILSENGKAHYSMYVGAAVIWPRQWR
jgi:hypothetical protein